jgi:hypothetical protein
MAIHALKETFSVLTIPSISKSPQENGAKDKTRPSYPYYCQKKLNKQGRILIIFLVG